MTAHRLDIRDEEPGEIVGQMTEAEANDLRARLVGDDTPDIPPAPKRTYTDAELTRWARDPETHYNVLAQIARRQKRTNKLLEDLLRHFPNP